MSRQVYTLIIIINDHSYRRLRACLLSYIIHHKWSWNFTVKLCGLSHLPAAWCNMSWTWNLITVVINRTKTSFTVLQT